MEAPELEARLIALEQAREAEKQEAIQQAFMNKYGSRISNNMGLGNVILNELARRGISTDAVTNEAVDGIINQLRMEAQSVLDATMEVQQQVDDIRNEANRQLDKIDAVKEAIETAAVVTGDTDGVMENIANLDAQTQVMNGSEAMMPPVPTPDEQAAPVEPPAEAPAESAPSEAPVEPPAEASAENPNVVPFPTQQAEELPQAAVSDKNMKDIKKPVSTPVHHCVSDANMKEVKKPVASAPVSHAGTLSAGIISACRGIN